MSTPIQLFMIACAIIIGLNSLIKGTTLATLPSSWFMADGSEYYLEIWLVGVWIFGLCLIVNYRLYYDRNSKTG